MKKTTKLWFMLAIAGVTVFSSCKKDDDEEPAPVTTTDPDACATANFPATTGDATIEILNFSSSTIEVEAGNVLSLAVQVTKGTKRAQKIRLFASDCANKLGDEYDLSDQPKGGKNGIDLRATDAPQVRNVAFTVPTGYTPIYLNIEIDEAGGNISYKRLTLNVSGSGVIDTWSDVILGANANAAASRMASGTGQTYTSCNAAENIDYIDITYRVNTTTPFPAYLCSNPARFAAPVGASTDPNKATGCGDIDELPTDGGNASYFKSSTADFDAATNTELEALTIANSDNQYAEVTAVGDVFEFMNNAGRKGLIKVTAIDQPNSTLGTITVSVKIQR